MQVFVLDSTENLDIYNRIIKQFNPNNIFLEKNIDKAFLRLKSNNYGIIILSKGVGKYDILDIVNVIKTTRLNNKSNIILISDSPVVSNKFLGQLRGYRIAAIKTTQLSELPLLLERALR